MKNKILLFIICVLILIDSLVLGLFSYLRKNIILELAGYLYTFFGETGGTANDVFISAAKHIIPFVIVAVLLVLIMIYFFRYVCRDNPLFILIGLKNKERSLRFNGITLLLLFVLMMGVSVLGLTLYNIDKYYYVTDYFEHKKKKTLIYDEYCVPTENVGITGEDTNNLILIYVESMECSFMSKEDGGTMDDELMPNLVRLANENINFSASDGVGGFNSTTNTTWTMGGIFASQSGLPFMFPIDGNTLDKTKPFATKVTTIGDILKEYDYTSEFLCGSKATFAGRDVYFRSHGYDRIFDYDTAVEKGYTDKFIWWGLEDRLLYEIAKDELTELAKKDEPFCLTMITVDTHHVGGYLCELCEQKYDIQYANVISCADRQVSAFVDWVKEQGFYENTTIVIMGDHPTMDSTLIHSDLKHSDQAYRRRVNTYDSLEDRYVYNCFINSKVVSGNFKNRQINTMDMFPTILASLGFQIQGDRLALGTNAFSDLKTLQEQTSFHYLNEELSKYSEYCVENFY